jgi:hypothetical protein
MLEVGRSQNAAITVSRLSENNARRRTTGFERRSNTEME